MDTTEELQNKIDNLEKQLADVKKQLEKTQTNLHHKFDNRFLRITSKNSMNFNEYYFHCKKCLEDSTGKIHMIGMLIQIHPITRTITFDGECKWSFDKSDYYIYDYETFPNDIVQRIDLMWSSYHDAFFRKYNPNDNSGIKDFVARFNNKI